MTTPTEHYIASIEIRMKELQRLKSEAELHRVTIDACCASGSANSMPTLYCGERVGFVSVHHLEKENAQRLAKALGGKWDKVPSSDGGLSYEGLTEASGHRWVLFDAEESPKKEPLFS